MHGRVVVMAVAVMEATQEETAIGDERRSIDRNINFILDKESCNLVQDSCREHHHDDLY